jgi:rieske iron-sulfur protein
MTTKRREIGRRAILEGGLYLGAVLCLPRCGAAAQGDAPAGQPKDGDLLVKGDDPGHRPLAPRDVVLNAGPMMVWPMDPAEKTVRSASRLNAVLLVRLEPAQLASDTLARAADGIVAYSAVCTHQGCEVGDWIADRQTLSCPCHDSEFDPKDDGKVVDGPAPRTLPALPLKVVGGLLVVGGAFSARPGFSS